LFAQANRDPKKSFPAIYDFWSIPALDEAYYLNFGSKEENEELKAKLTRVWQLKQN
jgi:hypothetical protein